jgi:hypothetical protein
MDVGYIGKKDRISAMYWTCVWEILADRREFFWYEKRKTKLEKNNRVRVRLEETENGGRTKIVMDAADQ